MSRALLIALLFAPLLAAADEYSPNQNFVMPTCGPAMDGQVMCRFGTLYECRYVDPDSLSRRTGWSWVGDNLRSCDQSAPAAAAPQLPPGFSYAPQYGAPAGSRR